MTVIKHIHSGQFLEICPISVFCLNIYFSLGLYRAWKESVWNPRWLFNGRLALTHLRNQVWPVFYDLINEQRCCETCVSLCVCVYICVCVCVCERLRGCLVSDRDLSLPHLFVWMLEYSPESHAGQAGISVHIFTDSSLYLLLSLPACLPLSLTQ